MAASDQITCILPVHNEALYLKQQVRAVESLLQASVKHYEILLVENGSTDASWSVINRLLKTNPRLRGLQLETASYGQAIRHGLLSSRYSNIIILNIDLIDANFIKQSIGLLHNHEVVVGSKTLASSYDHRPTLRKAQTRLLQLFLRIFFDYTGTDTHGIKAFKKTPLLLSTIFTCAAKHELFDTELLVRLHKAGASMTELPITITEMRPTRYLPWRRIRSTCIDIYRLWVFQWGGWYTHPLVTADDFGRNIMINNAILDQAQAGSIHGVSIMVNKISSKEAAMLQRVPKKMMLGVHLNFVDGKPVSPQQTVRSLVNSRGEFYSLPLFITKLVVKNISINELIIEAKAQIARARQLSIPINYVDSEQHTHLLPPVWAAIGPLAQNLKLRIRSRASTKHYLTKRPHKWLVFWCVEKLLSFIYLRDDAILKSAGLKTFDAEITHPGSTYD
jgi:glycosyltransferase involved in cell wall biosynthesis